MHSGTSSWLATCLGLLAVVALAGPAPLAAALEPGDYDFVLVHDGLLRFYEVHVPPGHDGLTAAPLVLDFHGFSSNSGQQQAISGFRQKSDEEGFVVAWPQGFGVLPSWNAETCCGDADLFDLDDVGLAVAIVQDLSSRTAIDAQRVYATGLSNGGALAHLIGCDAADVFAAVAPVSFPLPTFFVSSCRPSRPMPVQHFHGFQDVVVPYFTGIFPTFRSAQESFDAWSFVNRCFDSPSVTFSQNGSFCETRDFCSGDSEVTLCSLQGDHILYTNASDVDIPDLVWDFFSRHALD